MTTALSIRSDDKECGVHARYLSGHTIYVPNCRTVGALMVRIAWLNKRFASDILVLCEKGKLWSAAEEAPLIAYVVVKPEGSLNRDALALSLQLHAEEEDTNTCRRLVDLLRDNSSTRNLYDRWLSEWILYHAANKGSAKLHPLLTAGVHGGYALTRAAGYGDVAAVSRLVEAN